MDRISVEEIVRAVNGTLVRKCEEDHITGVKHDSRECQPGDMFVAVKGENQDGHRYIPQVVAAGCRTVMVSHREGWYGRDQFHALQHNRSRRHRIRDGRTGVILSRQAGHIESRSHGKRRQDIYKRHDILCAQREICMRKKYEKFQQRYRTSAYLSSSLTSSTDRQQSWSMGMERLRRDRPAGRDREAGYSGS